MENVIENFVDFVIIAMEKERSLPIFSKKGIEELRTKSRHGTFRKILSKARAKKVKLLTWKHCSVSMKG